MVINLEVRRFLDLEALEHGLTIFSFRLWTRVQFQTRDGWTPVSPALIDTGAPFSVLPKSLWSDVDAHPVGFTSELRGLIPLPTAMLKARLAQITCRLSDEMTTAAPMGLWVLLADGEVPIVLGCHGFLDRLKLMLDGPRQIASLEF